MAGGTKLNYATSGSGFSLNAPIHINGEINLQLSGGEINAMTFPGNIDGKSTVTIDNSSNSITEASIVLKGNNSEFSGIWNITNVLVPKVFYLYIMGKEQMLSVLQKYK